MNRMGLRQTFGWSIVGGSDVRSEKTLCHRVAVKELCAVSMRDILRVLESDFKEHKKLKKVSQEDLLFLEKMESGIRKTENLHYEMPFGQFYLIIVSWLSLTWNTSKESSLRIASTRKTTSSL